MFTYIHIMYICICISSDGQTERMFLQDHCYSTFKLQVEHPYACSGARWEKDLDPNQDELLKYVLDKSRPSEELIIKQGQICLTREDFWSLGLSQCMESNIGNACLKIVEEAARRHGKHFHIVDLYDLERQKCGLSALFPWKREGQGYHTISSLEQAGG
uniref:Uncharacterized protein n=1 Tax=Cyprinus carpio carpio TaxID=630221 RepID=A0A9J7ZX35_CYPCA